MTDIILSSFISLFALFGKEEQIDEERAKAMLVSYLRHQFGIRNIDNYLDLYSDMRMAYDMTEGLDIPEAVTTICSTLHGNIPVDEEALLLLRLMEFCGSKDTETHKVFKAMAKELNVPKEQLKDFTDFVNGKTSEHVILHRFGRFEGQLKTLLDPITGLLIFTYTGQETVLLNDVPVLSGSFLVWRQSGVLKKQGGKPVYYSTIIKKHQQKIGKNTEDAQVVEFCGRNINFRFPDSDNGMHNLSFTLHSGELLAIMGGSGTGKTTLLYLLNGSLKPQEGIITINGHDISEPAAKALIGFVPQDDLLIEELTVYENLWYTARLCFEGMPDEELHRRVTKILKDLELYAAKDLKVGSVINKFISGGQRKRLNIALELIREPAILFLDEPTSGLSSADTEKVVYLLKEQSLKGRLIITNIHQPSSDVYQLFDRLWLLDKGGYPVFDGNPIEAITYFKEAANYADAETSACPTCGNVNPEIVLNIIDEKTLNSSGEITDERKTTPQEWHGLYLKKRKKMSTPEVTDIPASQQKAPHQFKQFIIFLQRTIRTKITNSQYMTLAIVEAPLMAIVCGILTRFAPPEGYSVMDNKNMVSYFFMAIIVATFIGMSGSAEEIFKDRALLKREKFLNLSYGSYIWSKIVYMAIISLIQTFLFVFIGNMIMGINCLFGVWWLILFATSLLASLTGLLLSQCLNSIVSIYISIPILLIPQILLCGLVVSFSDLTPNSKTGNVPFIGNIIPSRWAYEALAVTSFTDNDYEKHFFQLDKKKFENQFYSIGYLYELQSQLETMNDKAKRNEEVSPKYIEVIRTNLPRLTNYLGMQAYAGDYSYESLKTYLKEAEDLLTQRGNKATLEANAKMTELLRAYGKEEVVKLKRQNYNMKLEDCVIGADQKHMVEVVDGHLVARMSTIFLTPQSKFGKAPFYSSEKVVGPYHIKTLWFNLLVMLMMCIITSVLLFTDWPGKIIRKDAH